MVAKDRRKPGEGPQACRKTWQDEGATPVMQLCFGTEIAAEQLMDQAGFQEACQLLYGPLLAQLRKSNSSSSISRMRSLEITIGSPACRRKK